jgi:hypothetical protein
MKNFEVYEISNTYTTDLSLDAQIELGICDWVAETFDGRVGFGHTKVEAITNLLGE